jgi:hypothetical protein
VAFAKEKLAAKKAAAKEAAKEAKATARAASMIAKASARDAIRASPRKAKAKTAAAPAFWRLGLAGEVTDDEAEEEVEGAPTAMAVGAPEACATHRRHRHLHLRRLHPHRHRCLRHPHRCLAASIAATIATAALDTTAFASTSIGSTITTLAPNETQVWSALACSARRRYY